MRRKSLPRRSGSLAARRVAASVFRTSRVRGDFISRRKECQRYLTAFWLCSTEQSSSSLDVMKRRRIIHSLQEYRSEHTKFKILIFSPNMPYSETAEAASSASSVIPPYESYHLLTSSQGSTSSPVPY